MATGAKRKPSTPREIGVNIRTPADWGGPDADQLTLTTFNDIGRATDAKQFSTLHDNRTIRDKLIDQKTLRRGNVFDELHRRQIIDNDQLAAAYDFLMCYAGSLGMGGQRDTEDRYTFVDYRLAMTPEAAFDRTRTDRDRKERFKATMGKKPFNLLQSIAIDWIKDTGRTWQDAVRGIYHKASRDTYSTYIITACDAVLDAREKGV